MHSQKQAELACEESGGSSLGFAPSGNELIEGGSACVVLGVLSLASYWAWIFAIFHSSVLDPFAGTRPELYLLICVLAAGGSAISLMAFIVASYRFYRVIDEAWFAVLLMVFSTFTGVPALAHQLGWELGLPQVMPLWFVGAFVSSFIYLKTGPFLVWLDRRKLMRCIALSFLLASFLLLLTVSLNPFAGIALAMSFPVVSTICAQSVNRRIGWEAPRSIADSLRDHLKMISSQISGFSHSIPHMVLYSFVFGMTSYTVLNLAMAEHMTLLIGVAILVSAAVFAGCAFSRKAEIDSERYRTLLLPLIAIALLPFPYVPDVYKILFLAIVVFGFTCFDAITWGDLADEIRDRRLPAYISYATPTAGNFMGVFMGWGVGSLMRFALGPDSFNSGFSVFSILAVILLVVTLTYDLAKREKEEVAEAKEDVFLDQWRNACDKIADSHNLTNQEKKIYLMLARGRNRHYIADELFISPHTVKTHAAHIYKKLGVHSQQELIDMVEGKVS